MAHSDEKVGTDTIDSLIDDLQLVEEELIKISRNIQKQKDIEGEHFDLARGA